RHLPHRGRAVAQVEHERGRVVEVVDLPAALVVVDDGLAVDVHDGEAVLSARFRCSHRYAVAGVRVAGVTVRWSSSPFSITNVAASSRECSSSFPRMFWMCVRAVSGLITSFWPIAA